jgi:hypothetical protein
MHVIEHFDDIMVFEVTDMGTGRWRARDYRRGVVNVDLPWRIESA